MYFPNSSTIAAKLTQGTKAIAAAGTSEPLAATETLVETVELHAKIGNTGAVFLGFASGTGNQARALVPGEKWNLSAPAGKKINLASLHLDAANSGDAVVWSASN